uniref:Palmitoyltransferase n=1 Tax=Chromera velia CCMP2878 TaxID=1169474 RepID=A0A0G4GDE7_9ALVE|eukprot:Cvel_635.t1-p1 / transcript=Cvel_635.t1 / gene=Cvel_635 / organism=Chromera_velia_CCMP2878 / gene_product=hypothetical protein / transcript_product=hypothetical protein / location=Cvel_scaffold19:144381-149126(-) / protein_length=570 / sequence_SO=supercontig / SO=protein_coding / is_pseudo=false
MLNLGFIFEWLRTLDNRERSPAELAEIERRRRARRRRQIQGYGPHIKVRSLFWKGPERVQPWWIAFSVTGLAVVFPVCSSPWIYDTVQMPYFFLVFIPVIILSFGSVTFFWSTALLDPGIVDNHLLEPSYDPESVPPSEGALEREREWRRNRDRRWDRSAAASPYSSRHMRMERIDMNLKDNGGVLREGEEDDDRGETRSEDASAVVGGQLQLGGELIGCVADELREEFESQTKCVNIEGVGRGVQGGLRGGGLKEVRVGVRRREVREEVGEEEREPSEERGGECERETEAEAGNNREEEGEAGGEGGSRAPVVEREREGHQEAPAREREKDGRLEGESGEVGDGGENGLEGEVQREAAGAVDGEEKGKRRKTARDLKIRTDETRIKYCSRCEVTTRGFDHHCVHVANCIAEDNYLCFFLFLVTTTLLCLFAGVIMTWRVIGSALRLSQENLQSVARGEPGMTAWEVSLGVLKENPDAIPVLLFAVLGFFSWGRLWVYHCWLLSKRMTTYEHILLLRAEAEEEEERRKERENKRIPAEKRSEGSEGISGKPVRQAYKSSDTEIRKKTILT